MQVFAYLLAAEGLLIALVGAAICSLLGHLIRAENSTGGTAEAAWAAPRRGLRNNKQLGLMAVN